MTMIVSPAQVTQRSLTTKAWLGINVGHGYTKAALLRENQPTLTVNFPSLVAPAERQTRGDLITVPTIRLDNKYFWVGEDATRGKHHPEFTQSRLRDTSYIPVLAKKAMQLLVEQLRNKLQGVSEDEIDEEITDTLGHARFVSGLPATWSQRRDLCEQLFQRIREGTAPFAKGKGRIIGEPTGCVYNAMLDDNGQITDDRYRDGKVAVIDFGHGTVDIAIVDRLVTQPQSLTTLPYGTIVPLTSLQKRLTAELERDFTIFEIEQALKTKTIRVAGKQIALPDGWDEPFRTNSATVAMELAKEWRTGKQFDAILLGGGAAELLSAVEPIMERFPMVQLTSDPQLSIALGYSKFGHFLTLQGL